MHSLSATSTLSTRAHLWKDKITADEYTKKILPDFYAVPAFNEFLKNIFRDYINHLTINCISHSRLLNSGSYPTDEAKIPSVIFYKKDPWNESATKIALLEAIMQIKHLKEQDSLLQQKSSDTIDNSAYILNINALKVEKKRVFEEIKTALGLETPVEILKNPAPASLSSSEDSLNRREDLWASWE